MSFQPQMILGHWHWKKAQAKEENEEKDIFPSIGLEWDVIETVRANEDPHRRRLRTFKRKAATAATR